MAEYSKPTDREIKTLMAQYDVGPVKGISIMQGGQANSSFRIETENGFFILSVCDEKNENETVCLTRVLLYLEDEEFPTSRLVKTRDNQGFIRYKGKPAYVKKYMTGRVIHELTPSMLIQVGKAMARLHQIPPMEILPDQIPSGIKTFEQVFDVEHIFVKWLGAKEAYLNKAIDFSMKQCFIHGDIFWDNLLFEEGRLQAVLDFEEACRYFKLYDIGMGIIGCCCTDGQFDMKKTAALIRGYQRISALTPQERRQLKVYIEYAATAAAFWRFRQYNIRHPNEQLADTYKELSDLADQIHEMDEQAYAKAFE